MNSTFQKFKGGDQFFFFNVVNVIGKLFGPTVQDLG